MCFFFSANTSSADRLAFAPEGKLHRVHRPELPDDIARNASWQSIQELSVRPVSKDRRDEMQARIARIHNVVGTKSADEIAAISNESRQGRLSHTRTLRDFDVERTDFNNAINSSYTHVQPNKLSISDLNNMNRRLLASSPNSHFAGYIRDGRSPFDENLSVMLFENIHGYFLDADHVDQALYNFLSWCNQEVLAGNEPIRTAAALRTQLMSIHPFLGGGNTRVSDIVMNLVLHWGGLPEVAINFDALEYEGNFKIYSYVDGERSSMIDYEDSARSEILVPDSGFLADPYLKTVLGDAYDRDKVEKDRDADATWRIEVIVNSLERSLGIEG